MLNADVAVELCGLLGRMANALEQQAHYSEQIRDAYAKRDREHADEKQQCDAQYALAIEAQSRTNAAMEEAVRNQRDLIARQDDSLTRQREHEARCEAWHRKHCGATLDERTEVIQ